MAVRRTIPSGTLRGISYLINNQAPRDDPLRRALENVQLGYFLVLTYEEKPADGRIYALDSEVVLSQARRHLVTNDAHVRHKNSTNMKK